MRKDIIPNRLLLFGAGTGTVIRAAFGIMHGMPADILVMVLEVIVLFFCLWPVYVTGGLGAGDCKLLLMTGVFLPVKQAVFVVISAFFIVAAEGLLLMAARRIKKEKRKMTAVHFAPSFLLAVLFMECSRMFEIWR